MKDLARLVADVTGAEISFVTNPRNEAEENELWVSNDTFLDLGLKPTTLEQGLLVEVTDVAKRFLDRVDLARIPCNSYWNRQRAHDASLRSPEDDRER